MNWNINNRIKKNGKAFFKFLGIGITSKDNLDRLMQLENSRSNAILELLSKFEPDIASILLANLSKSSSQLQQDLLVLGIHQCKKNGYFVEFGATNGIDLSNTFLLESHFGWNGILVEPGKSWHEDLFINRRKSIIETKCVWKHSNLSLTFRETNELELSTIESFRSNDVHSHKRNKARVYDVETISLLDLLRLHKAPKLIDFLSIDTEGSEYDILKEFDFESYRFSVIVCEHNYTENREKIFELLRSKGYVRVLEELSLFDDWYVIADMATGLKL